MEHIGRIIFVLLISLVLIALFLVFTNWQQFGSLPDNIDQLQTSAHWQKDRFIGPLPLHTAFFDSSRSWIKGNADAKPRDPVPVAQVSIENFKQKPASGLRVTWLGHSTVLLEQEGTVILTDPFWGNYSSPFPHLGPKRWYEPLMALDDLPTVDAVLISHDHYDHLDYGTIMEMAKWSSLFIVPLGVGSHLRYWGIAEERIVELDWWESATVNNLTITATPGRHTSGRWGVFKNGQSLWSGFAIAGARYNIWFSGDSGFFPGIKEIGDRLGPFDLTMIDIGQYNQSWSDWHMGPEQAVKAHKLVKGKMIMGIHWGLLKLSNHTWTEPVERLNIAAHKEGIDVVLPRPGETIEPGNKKQARTPWWPKLPFRTAEEYPLISTGL